jgi:PAS domain S-box-containing protein
VTTDTLQAQVARQALLSEIVLLIASTPDLDRLLSGVIDQLKWVIEFDRCTLALPNVDASTYRLRTLQENRRGYPKDILDPVSLQAGISGAVVRTGSSMVFPDFASVDNRPPPADDAMEGGSIRSILCLPLVAHDKVLGAITFGRSEKQPFDEQDFKFVQSVVIHLALAVERLNQLRELQDSQERHNLAMYATREGLWDWDLRSDDLYIEPSTKELLGLPPGNMSMTPQEWQARIHPDDLSIFRDGMRAYLRGETDVFREEFRVKDRTGAFRWVLHQGFGLRDKNERVYRMAGFMGDITERKNVENELRTATQHVEEANRTKDAFLADLSHASRIPLNAIIGYSEMLSEEIEDLGEIAEHLNPDVEKIRIAGRNLLDVIDTIIDHFKIEAGLVDVEYVSFDVEELVIDIGTSVAPLIEEKHNRLEITLDPNAGTMYSDPTKVRRTVFNLLSHAAKFTENATIMLDASRQYRRDGDTISISVACTEFDAKSLQTEGASRTHSQDAPSNTAEYASPGLGLAVSQYYCDLLGGEIAFDLDPASGSIAVITLPAAAK